MIGYNTITRRVDVNSYRIEERVSRAVKRRSLRNSIICCIANYSETADNNVRRLDLNSFPTTGRINNWRLSRSCLKSDWSARRATGSNINCCAAGWSRISTVQNLDGIAGFDKFAAA